MTWNVSSRRSPDLILLEFVSVTIFLKTQFVECIKNSYIVWDAVRILINLFSLINFMVFFVKISQ